MFYTFGYRNTQILTVKSEVHYWHYLNNINSQLHTRKSVGIRPNDMDAFFPTQKLSTFETDF